ncbi:hypothetical protein L218DRAFT_961233 [Marasmius fiardii PR-910]|nr:hypothetical protein L218DRAFT_961233 [Marasmius fiardii PR-910]
MNVRLLASGFGLSLTATDIYWCRREEKAFFSAIPKNLSTVPLLYLSCRYLTFIFHLIDIFVFSSEHHKTAIASKFSLHHCLLYTAFQQSTICVVFVLLHVILTMRVYALYGKSRGLGFLFGFLCSLRIIVGFYDLGIKVRLSRIDPMAVFDHFCFPKRSFPKDFGIAFFFLIEMTTQVSLCWLTLRKTMGLKDGWSFKASSVGSVLNRDALIFPISIFVLLVAILKFQPVKASLFIFPCLIAVPSCLGCHAIVDMQRLGDQLSTKDSEGIVFSTVDSAWDSRTHTPTSA